MADADVIVIGAGPVGMLAGTSGGHVWSAIRNLASLFFLHTPLRRYLIQLFSMQSIPCRNLKNYRKSFEKELKL